MSKDKDQNHFKQKNGVLLCILDGFGIAEKAPDNAISNAHTPFLDKLMQNHPNVLLDASGEAVGLPAGQIGNSEVGHLTIGAGDMIPQALLRISNAIALPNFAQDNSAIQKCIALAKSLSCTVHLAGLVSDGGVHGHIDHVVFLYNFLKQNGIKVVVHAITDGRDTENANAKKFLHLFDPKDIATISGRYYAMDRNNFWDRVELAYQAIAAASHNTFSEPLKYISDSYQQNITDEFLLPAQSLSYQGVGENDIFFFANYRADRARQISSALLEQNFAGFARQHGALFQHAFCMMSYSKQLEKIMTPVFLDQDIKNTIGEIVARNNMTQLRIAETEKYAHVTFFFNGGREEVFANEERILIPSPNVATYDLAPRMSAGELTSKLIEAIESDKYDFICANYANADMIGHTGNYEATVAALEYLDQCLAEVAKVTLSKGMDLIITADHGNAEKMTFADGSPVTSHTTNKVPLIYVGKKQPNLEKCKGLKDIAQLVFDCLEVER